MVQFIIISADLSVSVAFIQGKASATKFSVLAIKIVRFRANRQRHQIAILRVIGNFGEKVKDTYKEKMKGCE